MEYEPLYPLPLPVKVDGPLTPHGFTRLPVKPPFMFFVLRQNAGPNRCRVQVVAHEHVANSRRGPFRPNAGEYPILLLRKGRLTTPGHKVCGKSIRHDNWSFGSRRLGYTNVVPNPTTSDLNIL